MQLKKEDLAKILHDAERTAKLPAVTDTEERFREKSRTSVFYPFIEWDDLSEKAKDARRAQAQSLMDNFKITISRNPERWGERAATIEWKN